MPGTRGRIGLLLWAAVTSQLISAATPTATPVLTTTIVPSSTATVDPRDIAQCTETINECAAPALDALRRLPAEPGERELRQLCQLYPPLDRCVKRASQTRQCLATGVDQYAEYKAHPATKQPDVCKRYTSDAARCHLCTDVLLWAVLTAMLVSRWE